MRILSIGLLLFLSFTAFIPSMNAQDMVYQETLIIAHDSAVMGVAWHPTENKLASVSGNSIYIWDTQTGGLLRAIEAYPGEAVSVVWSPAGDRLASLGDNYDSFLYTAKIWDADSGILLHQLDAVSVLSIDWSPNGEFLLTVDDLISDPLETINVISVWYSHSGELEYRFNLSAGRRSQPYYQNSPAAATWVSNEQFVGINRSGPISIWNMRSLELVNSYYEPSSEPGIGRSTTQSITWNPSLNLLAMTSNTNLGKVYRINVLDLTTGDYVQLENSSGISAVAWSPDGEKLASCDSEGFVIRESTNFDTIIALQQEQPVTSVSWSPDGVFFATASIDGKVRIFEEEQLF